MSEPLNPQPQSGPDAAPLKDGWGVLHWIGDCRQRLGTSGALSGTSGRQFWTAWGTFAIVGFGVNILDITSILHERPDLPSAVPFILEWSSLTALLALLWLPWLAWRWSAVARPHTLLWHAVALPVFSAAHVSGFIALRLIAYRIAGWHYHPDIPGDYVYEFPKDVVAYVFALFAFATAARLVPPVANPGPTRALFDIRDGARLLRVPFDDILAVSSAGNYVEFVLRDGRKPLMRSPLSALESELAQHGFVRVHRSWLVNAMQMTGLKPEGSGDYTVELGDVTVPLSRRYPEALARLRAA